MDGGRRYAQGKEYTSVCGRATRGVMPCVGNILTVVWVLEGELRLRGAASRVAGRCGGRGGSAWYKRMVSLCLWGLTWRGTCARMVCGMYYLLRTR